MGQLVFKNQEEDNLNLKATPLSLIPLASLQNNDSESPNVKGKSKFKRGSHLKDERSR